MKLQLIFILSLYTFFLRTSADVKFASYEHLAIGDSGTITLLTNDGNNNIAYSVVSTANYNFTNNNNLNLGTYGAIIATAADYFGPTTGSDVICGNSDPNARFNDAFNKLWSTSDSAYLQRLFNEYQAEHDVLVNNPDLPPYEAYDKLDSGRWFDVYPSKRDYLNLLLYNFDHFTDCATQAYTVGHTLAITAASNAATILGADFDTVSGEERANRISSASRQLQIAYAMNAFSDHYLTDKFAAGHARTPRREIGATCADSGETFSTSDINDLGAAGLASVWMHDEDNRNGLLVANKRGDVFLTFGDSNYFDAKNANARPITEQAAQISRDEIFRAFRGNSTTTLDALNLVPEPSLFVTQYEANNTCPLFREVNGVLQIRRTGTVRPAIWYQNKGLTGGCAYDNFVEDDCNRILKGTILNVITDQLREFAQPQPRSLTYDDTEQAWETTRPTINGAGSIIMLATTHYLSIIIMSVLVVMIM